ncbi:MAG: sugar phosphate isomerase/epimerase family protein [Planctomycetota bacterium]
MNHTLGVCSWSLRPESPKALAEATSRCGLSSIQLALDPIRAKEWGLRETRAVLGDAGITIASGMMMTEGEDYTSLDSIRETGGLRPDEHWSTNLDRARRTAEIAAELGLDLVTFHAGFLPHDVADPERAKLIDRLALVADAFAEHRVHLGLETGQETALTLIDVLDELARPTVGVNFDPANMILYGMGEPTEAFERLLPYVAQVHVKDATPTSVPGTWGTEVVVGTGVVDWTRFLHLVDSAPRSLWCMIEREAGERRAEDIIAAREHIERVAAGAGHG